MCSMMLKPISDFVYVYLYLLVYICVCICLCSVYTVYTYVCIMYAYMDVCMYDRSCLYRYVILGLCTNVLISYGSSLVILLHS